MGQRAPYDNNDQQTEWESLIGRARTLLNNPDSSDDVKSEFSARFVMLMLGAMLVSRHKYGVVAAGFPERIDSIGAGGFEKWTDDQKDSMKASFKLLGSLGKRLNWYFFGDPNPEFGKADDEEEYFIVPGNAEYLVDSANYFMIEFMHPALTGVRYQATDRTGSPGRRARNELYEADRINQLSNTEVIAHDEVSTF